MSIQARMLCYLVMQFRPARPRIAFAKRGKASLCQPRMLNCGKNNFHAFFGNHLFVFFKIDSNFMVPIKQNPVNFFP